MKTSFVSVIALAMSAIAAPVLDARQTAPGSDGNAVGKSVQDVEKIVVGLGVKEITDAATQTPAGKRAVSGRQTPSITDVEGLTSLFTNGVSSMQGSQSNIGSIIQQFQAGDITRAAARDQSATELQNMHFTLTDIVTQLTGAAGLTVAGSDVDLVLNLVVTLVSIVLANVKVIVTVLGISPQLNSILRSVLGLVSKLLVLVTGLVVALVPGLVAALSPLLAGLGVGLLAPLLTPLAALLAGLGN